MKIDTAITEFVEKFDAEALASIEELSQSYGHVVKKHTMKLFNLQESCDRFNKWLNGYALFNIEEPDAADTPIAEITESFNRAIDEYFKSVDVTYDQFVPFVRGYVESIDKTLQTVDTVTKNMMSADVDPERIGMISEYVDKFIDKFNESFYPAMDMLLTASGYNTRKALFGKKEKHSKPMFV